MSVSVVAKDASLTSLSVTITALVVSGKQMTLAVFRQLPAAEALKENGQLAILGWWGRVRYSIKDEGVDEWIVAEHESALYRCAMPSARPWNPYEGELYRAEKQVKDAGRWPHAAMAEIDGWRRRAVELKTQSDEWEKTVRPQIARSRAILLALPQLFIAV